MNILAAPVWLPLLLAVSAAEGPSLEDSGLVKLEYRCRRPPAGIDCEPCVNPRHATGTLRETDAWTLHLQLSPFDVPLDIPRESVTRAWVADGTRSNVGLGLGIGFLAGAIVGGVIGSTQDFCLLDGCSPATPFGVIAGAPIGALLGAMIGAGTRSTHWREVPVDQLAVLPGGGPGLSLSRTW